MPFGRRNKKKDFLNLRNIFNNLLNFSRTRKYISLSIKRMRASPNELALGLACGIAISFTPFIGLHALLSIFFAWVQLNIKKMIVWQNLGSGAQLK